MLYFGWLGHEFCNVWTDHQTRRAPLYHIFWINHADYYLRTGPFMNQRTKYMMDALEFLT